MRRAIVSIDKSVLAEALKFPAGTEIVHVHDELDSQRVPHNQVQIVVDSPDLPDVEHGHFLTIIRPQYEKRHYESVEFVSWH